MYDEFFNTGMLYKGLHVGTHLIILGIIDAEKHHELFWNIG